MAEEDIEIIEGDESSFKDLLKKIKEELKICRKEKEEYLAGWQRARADFINYKKDEEKTREEFSKFATKNVWYDVLCVLDSVDIALKQGESVGIKEIKGQFLEILKRNGIEEIEAGKGNKFNPVEHEALIEEGVETDNNDGVIIEELQKGYKLFNRVLRPTKVKVGIYKVKP